MASAGEPHAPSEATYLRLVGLGALVGIPAALVAALFLALVHVVEHWLWTDLPDWLGQKTPPWYLVITLPIFGAALVLFARRCLPGDGGGPPLEGIGGGAVPWRYGPSIALAALGTLAFGAVLGPEAPLIALGSVVGMVVVTFAHIDGPAKRVLATAGSFSAVSALFGGPLVAAFLLLEAGLSEGAALTPALLPGLVAAAVGYVLFIGLGNWGGLKQATLTISGLPPYHGTHLADLLLAIVVGLVVALVTFPIRRLAFGISARARAHLVWILIGGGAAVGLLAEGARLLGGNSQEVFFSGQASVPAEVVETSVVTLLVVLVAKSIAYAVSLGCGYRGGPVFPAIFLGIGVAMCAVIWFGTSPTWAVAVGAAAGMTAGTRLIFASLLFGSLLAGSSGVDALPAAVLAAVTAWLVSGALRSRWPEPAV